MSVTERLTPSRDHVVRETRLAPERPGEPPLRLRHEGERVTASFVLTLAGVARHKAGGERLSAGWPVLGAGQGLDAVYQVAAGRLECMLWGHGQADDAAAAVVDARALWRNLDIGLRRGLGDYHFVPSDDPVRLESAAAFGWRVVLRPLRLQIAARPPFGYLAPAEPERLGLRVAHPPLRPTGHFNALIDALGWGGALEIQLQARPCQLTLPQEALLRCYINLSMSMKAAAN